MTSKIDKDSVSLEDFSSILDIASEALCQSVATAVQTTVDELLTQRAAHATAPPVQQDLPANKRAVTSRQMKLIKARSQRIMRAYNTPISETALKHAISREATNNHPLQEYIKNYKLIKPNANANGNLEFDAMDLNRGISLNSTLLSQRSIRTKKGRTAEEAADHIDLIAEHYGKRYSNVKHFNKRKDIKDQKHAKKNAGNQWYNLPQTRVTKQMKLDWATLQNKGMLTDNNASFVRVEKSKMPEFFQIGRYVDNSLAGNNRLSKKERKMTITEQFMADSGSALKKRTRNMTHSQQTLTTKATKRSRR